LSANTKQSEYWNGDAAGRWTRGQEAADRALASIGRAVLDRAALRAGEAVIDVGCGCGALALDAADVVGPSGRVTGVDISAPMLARARERAAGRANVAFVEADAAAHRFDRSFDAIVSRFGVMFFDDPVGAFRNLCAALRSGGRIVFACWRPAAENPWVTIPREVTARHLTPPAPPAPDEPGPFAFADRARVERVLAGAGFASIAVDAWNGEVLLSVDGPAAAADFVMTVGMTATWLADADDATRSRVRADLVRALAPHEGGRRVTLGGAAWIASAIAP